MLENSGGIAPSPRSQDAVNHTRVDSTVEDIDAVDHGIASEVHRPDPHVDAHTVASAAANIERAPSGSKKNRDFKVKNGCSRWLCSHDEMTKKAQGLRNGETARQDSPTQSDDHSTHKTRLRLPAPDISGRHKLLG